MDDNTFIPRGNSEPNDSVKPPVQVNPALFTLTVTQDPLDYLLARYGVMPSFDLRFAVAQELNALSTIWLDRVIQQIASRILANN